MSDDNKVIDISSGKPVEIDLYEKRYGKEDVEDFGRLVTGLRYLLSSAPPDVHERGLELGAFCNFVEDAFERVHNKVPSEFVLVSAVLASMATGEIDVRAGRIYPGKGIGESNE